MDDVTTKKHPWVRKSREGGRRKYILKVLSLRYSGGNHTRITWKCETESYETDQGERYKTGDHHGVNR